MSNDLFNFKSHWNENINSNSGYNFKTLINETVEPNISDVKKYNLISRIIRSRDYAN